MHNIIKLNRGILALTIILFVLIITLSVQGQPGTVSTSPSQDADELAKKLSNPVAALISAPVQFNVDYGYSNHGWKSVTNIQPVVPIGISPDWNLISRTIVPIVFQQDISGPGNSEEGIGDVVQSVFLSPKQPTADGLIWGVGPAMLLPTGGHHLGTNRWAIGPTGVGLIQDGPWTSGLLVNHLWDFAGSGKADISVTLFQPFLSWGGLGGGQTVTINLESSYDWKARQWTAPANLGYSKITKIGGQLISYSFGIRGYLDAPAGGPDWGLRFAVTLLFPKE